MVTVGCILSAMGMDTFMETKIPSAEVVGVLVEPFTWRFYTAIIIIAFILGVLYLLAENA